MNKILIVEDEFSISNFMKTVLEGDGYAVEVATCAAQARTVAPVLTMNRASS